MRGNSTMPDMVPARTVTVKLGGSAIDDEKVIHELAEDVAALLESGFRFIIVHGGGKAISREMEAAGISPVKVAGLRVTDDATMTVVEQVMIRINEKICAIFRQHGVVAKSVLGASGLLSCVRLSVSRRSDDGTDEPIDLGRVGRVRSVNPIELNEILSRGGTAIVAPYGRDDSGQTLNINADTAAGSIAGATSEEFVLITDVDGVRLQGDSCAQIAETLNIQEIERLIDGGVIREGMLPKVEACVHAIESGVKIARIVNGFGAAPLRSALSEQHKGTSIVR